MKFCFITRPMNRLIIVLLSMWSVAAVAQRSTLTPYSIYGLGEPSRSPVTAQSAMGHTGLAVLNSTTVNSANPASYGEISKPVFNFDLRNEFLILSSPSTSQSNSQFSIQNFSFAFPLVNDLKKKRRAGFSFGITPYTRQGYDLYFTEEQADLGEIEYQFTGTGGINNGYIGWSYDLLADRDSAEVNVLSLGVNGNYLFGQLNQTRTTQFSASAAASNLYRSSELEMSAWDVTVGALFKKKVIFEHYKEDTLDLSRFRIRGDSIKGWNRLKRDAKADDIPILFSAGAYFRPSMQMRSFYRTTAYTYSDTVPSQDPIDTIDASSSRGNVVSPASYGVGLSMNVNNRWVFALDLSQTLWTQLEVDGTNAGLNDATRIGLGVEYLPDYTSYQDFLKTVRYRAGFSMEQTLLNIGNSQPTRYGINFGLGIPLVASNSYPSSMFNIGVELAQRQGSGTELRENFFNLHAGFTITPNRYDGWFVKKKYD